MKIAVVFIAGVFLLAQGVLFTLQGAGLVTWPASSFMINNQDWIERGVVIALLGIVVILGAWWLQKKS